jgi:hypothetical protein
MRVPNTPRLPIYTFVSAHVEDIEPAHPIVHNHHITIKFKPDADDHASTPYDETCWWVIEGRVITDDVDALIVRFVGGPITDDHIASGVPHITISCADGVKPSASIEAIKTARAEGTVIPFTGFGHGHVGRYDYR